MAENPDRYIIKGKTDLIEQHPPKLYPLGDESKNMTMEEAKKWFMKRLEGQKPEDQQAEFSFHQRTLMKLDQTYQSQPFSEQAAKDMYQSRFEILYSQRGRKVKLEDPFNDSSFECDTDDPDREAKEAEYYEKRGERLEQKINDI